MQLVFLICLAHWLLGDFVELNTLHSSGNRAACKEDRIFFIMSWIMMWLLWTHNLFCSSRNHTSSRSTIHGTWLCSTCMYSHAVQFHGTLKKNYCIMSKRKEISSFLFICLLVCTFLFSSYTIDLTADWLLLLFIV